MTLLNALDFRENANLTGEQLQYKQYLANAELKRLEKWAATKEEFDTGKDFGLKL